MEKGAVMLNEIGLHDKWVKETGNGRTNLGYRTYAEVCSVDPTVRVVDHNRQAGKYCNWLLRVFDMSKVNDSEYKHRLKVALEQYDDGLRRGILSREGISGDIGRFKSVDEFLDVMDKLMGGDKVMVSKSVSNNMDRLKGQYDVVGESRNWLVVAPKTWEAERYFGSGTEWCTVGNENYFNEYMEDGRLYITIPKSFDNKLKMQFHFNSGSFADYTDNVVANPKMCIYIVVGDGESFDEVCDMWSRIDPKFSKYYRFVKFSEVDGMLESGANVYDVFDHVSFEYNGFRVVELNDLFNYIDRSDNLLSPDLWFVSADNFGSEGFTLVGVLVGNDIKYNFLTTKGTFLYDKPMDEWFDRVREFFNGFAVVGVQNSSGAVKYNYIGKNGELLWKRPVDEWFKTCTTFFGDDGGIVTTSDGDTFSLHADGKLYEVDPSLLMKESKGDRLVIGGSDLMDLVTESILRVCKRRGLVLQS